MGILRINSSTKPFKKNNPVTAPVWSLAGKLV